MAENGIAGNLGARRDNRKRFHHGVAVHVAELADKGVVADHCPARNKRGGGDHGARLHGGVGFDAAALLELCTGAHVCRGVHENRGGNAVVAQLLGKLAAQFRIPDGHKTVAELGGEFLDVAGSAHDGMFRSRRRVLRKGIVEESDALENAHGLGDFLRHDAILTRPENKEILVLHGIRHATSCRMLRGAQSRQRSLHASAETRGVCAAHGADAERRAASAQKKSRTLFKQFAYILDNPGSFSPQGGPWITKG